MRRFKVLNIREKINRVYYKNVKTADGTTARVPVHYEVERGEKDPHRKSAVWNPGAYGHEDIYVGDILELEGAIADKAARNPDFQEVFEIEAKPEEPQAAPKKKRGRPKKVA